MDIADATGPAERPSAGLAEGSYLHFRSTPSRVRNPSSPGFTVKIARDESRAELPSQSGLPRQPAARLGQFGTNLRLI